MQTISYKWMLLAILSIYATQTNAQHAQPFDSLVAAENASGGHMGYAMVHKNDLIHKNDYIFHQEHDHFPMMSVFKFPLALYILDQADKRNLSLDEKVTIDKGRWKMHSPFLDRYTTAQVFATLRDLTHAIIEVSDNVACDILLQRIGGPAVLNAYVHHLGLVDINIAWTEAQMAAEPTQVYDNWCTPPTMDTLLQSFAEGHLLSPAGTSQLRQWMIESVPGAHRIKGGLPPGTIVAHKTGTSNTDANGLTAATNDVGIITLSNGSFLYLAVFITDSHANEAARENAIARIARYAYKTYSP
jgi:beta-lactamase class A